MKILRVILAGLILSLLLVRLAPLVAQDQSSAGFYLVAVDDCGNPAHEAHLVEGRDGEIPAFLAPAASPEEKTISGGAEVVYRYSGLVPGGRYKLRVVYLGDHAGQAVKLSAGGIELETRFEEPEHQAAKREIDITSKALQNGVLELKFEAAAQREIAVSLIELWSTAAELANNLNLQVGGDSQGGITGVVTDWLNRPAPRTLIRVQPPDSEEIRGTADAAGRFSIRAPLAWRSGVPGLVNVRAVRGKYSASSTINSLEIFAPDIHLTPRPSAVPGTDTLKVDLGGTWNYVVQPAPRFWEQKTASPGSTGTIQVPGEWAMQGYTVPKGGAAGYWRTVEIPRDWEAKRIKLKCDAAFSLAEVWVNGKNVGQYEGGFTPFEFDITEEVESGKSAVIALRIEQDTMAADLSSMINYAQHDLGGLTRKIYLFAVPDVNLYRLHAETRFDSKFQDATLHLTLGVANQSRSTVEGAKLRLRLTDPEGKPVTLHPDSAHLPGLRAGEDRVQVVDIPVTKPQHWENEHPWLYKLTAELVANGSTVETAERRIGFRQIEIRGNQLILNGQPIKLHGVERHETNPARGRSLQSGMWSLDAKLLHEANMNYVFTSHYPVPEEFLDACDELGLLVTEEMPSVWVGWQNGTGDAPKGSTDPRYYQTMATIAATAIEKDRSHPSIVFWQTCDECIWGRNYSSLMSLFATMDSSRPVNFSYEAGTSKFFSQHYPSIDEARKAPADGSKPIIYDQYCHINNYNRREHYTDPGLRDYYGKAIAPMWDAMYLNPGIAGGAIWEWSDDVFQLPPSGHERNRFQGYLDPQNGRWLVGYGPWGIVDSWLRKKPEFWNVKKAYSPVRIREHEAIPVDSSRRLRIPVENRYFFTNLNELKIDWVSGQSQGTATGDVPPNSKGVIEIPLPEGAAGNPEFTLKFFNRGELVDAYILPIGKVSPVPAEAAAAAPSSSAARLEQGEKSFVVRAQDSYWEFDRKTGLLVAGGKSRQTASVVGGPYLAITPLELAPFGQISGPNVTLQPPVMNWTTSNVEAQVEGCSVVIRASGSYPDYSGAYTARIDGSGRLTMDYRFEFSGAEARVREIGLLFDAPATANILHWKHKTQWSYYPDGHIGRPQGSAPAFRDASAWPKAIWGETPPWPWELDATAEGTNDFRSSKFNILWASLTNAQDQGLRVDSDGRQTVRAWVDRDRVRLLVSDFANGGSEVFLRDTHWTREQKTLHKGDVISGTVRLSVNGEPQ
jgi:beta-galactosidase